MDSKLNKVCQICSVGRKKLYNCELCEQKFCIDCMYLFCFVCKKYYTCFICGVKQKEELEVENIMCSDKLVCKKHNDNKN